MQHQVLNSLTTKISTTIAFNVVTELTYKNGDDEFRPDITLLINGMPLAFIEVKKPNNQEGVLAERDRINVRFKNKKFPQVHQHIASACILK
jgi:type I site-specific restriction-modification system R (restriction) subunit